MALSRVTSQAFMLGASGGTSAAINTTGADLLVVCLNWASYSSSTPTLSDSKGNTWLAAGATANAIGNVVLRIFYARTPTVGTGHTFTATGTNVYPYLTVLAYSGAHLGTPLSAGTTGNNTAASTSLTGGTPLTPTTAGAVVVAAWAGNDSPAPTNPLIATPLTVRHWTNFVGSTVLPGAVADDIQGVTATTVTPLWTWTTVAGAATQTAAFLPAVPPTETVQSFIFGL